ncbi:MAG: hypothetical protein WCG42_08420 [Parachlamydiaceae bacterium]
MNNSKMEWLAYAKTDSPMDGRASPTDEKGQAFVIEWKRTDILSSHLAAFKKDLSDLAAETLSKSELAFLKVNPEGVAKVIVKYRLPQTITSDKYSILVQKQSGAQKGILKVEIDGKTIYDGLLEKDIEAKK